MASYLAWAFSEDKASYLQVPSDSPRSVGSPRMSGYDSDDNEHKYVSQNLTANKYAAALPRWRWARTIGLISAGFVLGWGLAVVAPAATVVSEALQNKAQVALAVPVQLSQLPYCERVMLFDWATMRHGLGSTMTTVLQAAYIAQHRNYTLIIARDPNVYGTYYEMFAPHEPEHCRLSEDMYEVDGYEDGVQKFRDMMAQGTSHVSDGQPSMILFHFDLTLPINSYMRLFAYGTYADLDTLPPLDARHPLDSGYTVPDLFKSHYHEYEELSGKFLSLNRRLDLQVDQLVYELEIGERQVRPSAGVHWRSGDKLAECDSSELISCANVTRHCETAWIALDEVNALVKSNPASTDRPEQSMSAVKAAIAKLRQKTRNQPRLLLMTAERDGVDLFKADPYCTSRFAIQGMPQRGNLASFAMTAFNRQSKSDRTDNAQQLLVQTTALTRYADVAVFGIISNIGKSIAFPRAGSKRVLEEKRIRSVDVYWHPMQYAPFAGSCDGTWGPCWPGM